MVKKALITGITGQDGSYLAEYLLEQGYEVHGIIRRLSVAENQSSRIEHIHDDIHTYYGDLLDEQSLHKVVAKVRPDEIYNIAAMSQVRVSFDIPAFTIKTNSLGPLCLLEIMKEVVPEARYYQASSSEMFGNQVDNDGYQRLTTPMIPISPYGCSKLMAFHLTNIYRDSYKLKCSNGILFNHESPRRGTTFVTNKVVKGAVEIKKGLRKNISLGNMDSFRDWGHSYDYVRAMHMINNHSESRNWIVATGETKSVRNLCETVFDKLSLNYEDYVLYDEKYARPQELNYLKGDSSDIRQILGWKSMYTFDTMIDEMIEHWLKNV